MWCVMPVGHVLVRRAPGSSSPGPSNAREGTPQVRVAIHHCADLRHGGLRRPTGRGQSNARLPGGPGVMKAGGLAPGRCRTSSRCDRDDHAVSHAVVHERDDLSRDGDTCDPAGAGGVAVVGGDALEVALQPRAVALLLGRLDRREADQTRSLLICGLPCRQAGPDSRQLLLSPVPERSKPAREGPLGGEALTARDVVRSTLGEEARQGFLVCSAFFLSGGPPAMRASLLSLALGTGPAARWRSGRPDEHGAAARSWSAVPKAATGSRGAGRRSSMGGRRHGRPEVQAAGMRAASPTSRSVW